MARVTPSVHIDIDAAFERANQLDLVRAKIRDRTEQIAARARRIDVAENNGRATISTEYETVASRRFVGRVVTDDVSGEHGDSVTRRRRTLRRAMGGRR